MVPPTPQADNVIADPAASIQADVAVIGSGPGGAITAALLAEAGRDVLMVEEGAHLSLASCSPFTQQEMVQKYRHGGITVATGPCKIAYVEGRCTGGGSEINSGLYHRTPPDIVEAWRRDHAIDAYSTELLEPHFAACEHDLSVSCLPGQAPAASLRLHDGARALGWSSMEVPRWYKHDGPGAGGQRQSMTQTFIPRALAAGAGLLPDTRVDRLEPHSEGWRLTARHGPGRSEPRNIEIRARCVFLACGAVQTPALLRRSGIKKNVGDSLRLHATVKVVARFPDTVNTPGMGVPVHQVKEFAPRFSMGCSISSLPHLALAMLDHPEHLSEVDRCWPRMAIYYAMICGGRGAVRTLPGFRDPLVKYRLAEIDMRDLSEALRSLCRALLASGAQALYPSVRGHPVIRSEQDLIRIPRPLPTDRTNLMTIHLMGSCPMGEARDHCPVDSFGRVHGAEGLYVADASLLGGAPGVNPQGSIMAAVRRNAMEFLGEL